MALINSFRKLSFSNNIINAVLLSLYTQNQNMSQYPKYYVDPIYEPKKLTSLIDSSEALKLAHVPTKAALTYQTASVYHDPLVCTLINYIMRDGQKMLARNLIDRTFEQIKRTQLQKYHKAKTEEERAKIELSPNVIFHRAIENCKPILELMPIKRGGVTYQVPVPLTAKRSQFLSMKWLIVAGKDKERIVNLPQKLSQELIDAAHGSGRVVKRKQDLHKQCEANRAYAHYRWS